MTGQQSRESDVQTFYSQWARLYDLIARRLPGVRRIRRTVTAACRLEPGDTVVEFGCGTGANLPYLADAVGPTGRVVGIDFTDGVLAQARRRTRAYENVDLVLADATQPPVSGSPIGTPNGESTLPERIDAIVATFVVGMFDEPEGVVDTWCDLLPGGSRLVLANASFAPGIEGALLNPLLRVVTVCSTPPTTRLRYDPSPAALLDERVRNATDRLTERSAAVARSDHLGGIVTVVGGIVGGVDGGNVGGIGGWNVDEVDGAVDGAVVDEVDDEDGTATE